QLADLRFDLAGDRAQVAARDVAGHVQPPRGELAFDLVGSRLDIDVGHVFERRLSAEGQIDRQLAKGRDVGSHLRNAADDDVKRTCTCGTSTWASTFRFVTPATGSIVFLISSPLARRTSRSGPYVRTTIVAPAPESTSLMRSFRYVSKSR